MSVLQDVLRRNRKLIFLMRHFKRNKLNKVLLTCILLKLMLFYSNNLAFLRKMFFYTRRKIFDSKN